MKKVNISKIIWVSSLFLVLIIILLLIMNYKINYQYLSYDYLYFYECDDNLCVSQVRDNSSLVYGKYDCGYDECPKYVKSIQDGYVVLEKDKKKILYNYEKSKVISDSYDDYEIFINDDYIIVSLGDKRGIISSDNKVLAEVKYDELGYRNEGYLSGYNFNHILVKNGELYGIISYKDGKIIEEIKYKEEEIKILLEKLK